MRRCAGRSRATRPSATSASRNAAPRCAGENLYQERDQMLAGHFGLAAAVKSREPQLPLWSLMLCTQLLDVIFVILYGLGIESFTPVPGTSGGYGNFIFRADYTHSLVGALALSVVVM